MKGYLPPSLGFTLLEVMVALAVLSVGVVTVVELFGGSLRLEARASQKTEAVVHARALMDEMYRAPDPQDEEEAGRIGGAFSWRRVVRPAEPADGGPERESLGPITLKVVEVEVGWVEGGREKSVRFSSLRIVAADRQGLER